MTAKETIAPATNGETHAAPSSPARPAHGAALEFGKAWTYAPAPEAADHVRIDPRYELFIGGKWVAPSSGKYFDTVSPSTEQKLAEVAEGNERDVDLAVKAARVAYEKYWSKLSGIERGKYIYRIARVIQEKARELAIVETMDGGKPIKESRDVDLPLVAAHFFYYAGWADKLAYAFPGRSPRPLGVAGQVIPWNFPLLMAAWKLAPALAAGNTCVLKPAETTPLTALLLAKILEECDLPPGVVNIVTGAGPTGAALVAHPDVDKVAFTGSTDVGKRIQKALSGTKKKLTLELGGKAANIVFADAPLDQAVEGIISGIFFNQGHVCCAGSRLLVEEGAFEPLLRRLRDRMQTLRVGDPLDKNTDVGAINSKMQLDKIRELVDAGEREGATRFSTPCELPARGYWFAPTLFTGVSQSHRIAREEIFGPVLAVMTFRTPDEAVEKANNTMYGLSAGVWTDKGSKSFWVSQKLRAGVVWANTYNKFDPSSPFGGYKESGFGREGGRQGLLPYLEVD
ncbi:aldehyde dehydrogenase family protein [Polyangium sorediatum]|uniref:Aldehyde dehydrogenase family protein n=1 Tax=Polyangium sorediatum TaxID=889274 RepID=A0ABT6P9F8_9BACT|nr:aldehyde dehydrogenase family protein [Polyangium sorediatum]MDI1437169.1 aldehyde dehydrogenase family protein [Polyangium sorediatum]